MLIRDPFLLINSLRDYKMLISSWNNSVGSLSCSFLTASVKSRPRAVAMSRHTSAVLRRMAIWVISRCVMEPSWKRGLNAAAWGGWNRVPQRRNTATTTSETITVHNNRCCGKIQSSVKSWWNISLNTITNKVKLDIFNWKFPHKILHITQ